MTTKSVGNIRLATGDGRSDLLYNAYHLLTQLFAMYSHFKSIAQSAENKQIFETFSVGIMTDIGDLYNAWEALLKKTAILGTNSKLAKRLIVTNSHLFKVIALTDTWTPSTRMITISILIERKWLRVLDALKDKAGEELSVLIDLKTKAEVRVQSLNVQVEKEHLNKGQVQKAFDAAEIALLDKNFGF